MSKRHAPATYHAFSSFHDPLPGGRFAAIEPRTIVGSAPTYQAPRQPEGSPWHHDPVPDEEPLGIDVTATPDIGEPVPSPPQPRSIPVVAKGGEGRAPANAPEQSERAPNLKRRRLPE
jgi:hypothetical protein